MRSDGEQHDHQPAVEQGADTIPQPVRAALRRRGGDEIAYAVEADLVVVTRVRPDRALREPFRNFAEWDSPADTEAYARL